MAMTMKIHAMMSEENATAILKTNIASTPMASRASTVSEFEAYTPLGVEIKIGKSTINTKPPQMRQKLERSSVIGRVGI
jgi:hypothetical protein